MFIRKHQYNSLFSKLSTDHGQVVNLTINLLASLFQAFWKVKGCNVILGTRLMFCMPYKLHNYMYKLSL